MIMMVVVAMLSAMVLGEDQTLDDVKAAIESANTQMRKTSDKAKETSTEMALNERAGGVVASTVTTVTMGGNQSYNQSYNGTAAVDGSPSPDRNPILDWHPPLIVGNPFWYVTHPGTKPAPDCNRHSTIL